MTDPSAPTPRKSPRLSVAALVLSLIGLLVAAGPTLVTTEAAPAHEATASPAPSVAPTPAAQPSASPNASPSETPGSGLKQGLKGLLTKAKDKKAAHDEERVAKARADAERKAVEGRAAERLRLYLLIGAILGGLGILLGVVSLVRRESVSVSLAAIAVGLMAALWIYVLLALILAVLVMLVAGAIKGLTG